MTSSIATPLPGFILFLTALVFLAAGALLPLILPKRGGIARLVGSGGAWLGCGAGIISALLLFREGGVQELVLPWPSAGINLIFHLDPLAAFFLLPLFVICLAATLYAPAYLGHDHEESGQGFHWFFLNILIASMALVITSANGLQFLIAWELMSLSSFFLVISDHRSEEARRAGWLYLLATHIGAAFLFAFFLEAGRLGGSLDFASFSALRAVSPRSALFLFFLILVGFGAKAGLFPFHVWLPDAHPAAPSHVSAIMSGVMLKTAVYGFLRMVGFLPPLPAWCGLLLLFLGMAGALFGILLAVIQVDIKRSLAYSSVENIGLIFFGLGLWLYGSRVGQETVAALALAGALLHIWNHALFKGLLFLGAGSLYHATGSRLLSHYGGLLRRLPWTGGLLLVGGAAISALPPLNGFISEWFLYLGIMTMGQNASGAMALLFLILTALLGLVGAGVLLALSRLLGIALLGSPRHPEAAQAHEAPWSMRISMGLLAGLVLLIGIAPVPALQGVSHAMSALGSSAPLPTDLLRRSLPLPDSWTLASLLFLALLFLSLRQRTKKGRDAVRASTWGCGYLHPTPRMTYMAGGFSQLAQSSILCACLRPRSIKIPGLGLFPPAASFSEESLDPVLTGAYIPFFSRLANRAFLFRRLQAGQLSLYLLYMFLSITLLLLWVTVHP